MAEISAKKRIWGWFFFDWSSQPYNTLLLTFIFGPYIASVLGDGSKAQSAWGFGVGAAGIVIAILAPILGAIADKSGNRVRWIWLFSAMYVVGSFGLWWSAPDGFNLIQVLLFFAIGLIGMEFATIFTNSMLPDLGTEEEIGKISGSGWAFGYIGGLITLVMMLLLFREGEDGKTLLDIDPIFGLDAATREGTRFVGPLSAIWYAVFMVPFFMWVKDPIRTSIEKVDIPKTLRELGANIKRLPKTPSLFAYLGSSMLYRDALNGIYTFGGIYAAGVLGWTMEVGVFGIIALITGAIFAFIGGRADSKFGPKPVITVCILVLTLCSIAIVFISRETLFFIPVTEGSMAPDIAFYALGAIVGAAGGAVQSASRSMMVKQADPARMTEAFGLYALAGKATSFIAPLSIGLATWATGSQRLGITPLIVLFIIGLILLKWVKPNGDHRPL